MSRAVRTLVLIALAGFMSVPAFAQRNLFRVYVEVRDASGQPVSGLTAADFEVYQDGTSRQVTRATFEPAQRVLLIVDTSRAMEPMLVHFRNGLAAFLDALPGTPEVGLVTTGGQLRLRAPVAVDRQKLTASVASLAHDGGANAFFDVLFEADRRFLAPKPANNAWPVIVILSTDQGENRDYIDVEAFNRLVNDLIARGASAHAVVIRGPQSGMVSDVTQNLVQNLNGVFEPIAISNALPDIMKGLAERVADDFTAMTARYEVEYQGDAQSVGSTVNVRVKRLGTVVAFSVRRPF